MSDIKGDGWELVSAMPTETGRVLLRVFLPATSETVAYTIRASQNHEAAIREACNALVATRRPAPVEVFDGED